MISGELIDNLSKTYCCDLILKRALQSNLKWLSVFHLLFYLSNLSPKDFQHCYQHPICVAVEKTSNPERQRRKVRFPSAKQVDQKSENEYVFFAVARAHGRYQPIFLDCFA